MRKEALIDSFITLIHELGHVLFSLTGVDVVQNKSGRLFTEISGQYFERLAIKFLIEKKIYLQQCKRAEINAYNMIKRILVNIKPENLWETFFIGGFIEISLCEIYSYLGSLELISRYHGDYEKQLSDLIQLTTIREKSINEFLMKADFEWRKADFKVLQKHRD